MGYTTVLIAANGLETIADSITSSLLSLLYTPLTEVDWLIPFGDSIQSRAMN